MAHDVNFSELKTPIDDLDNVERGECIDNLREFIAEYDRDWSKLAAILQVKDNDHGAVFAKTRVLMANLSPTEESDINLGDAKRHFVAFNEVHRQLDEAIAYEFERYQRLNGTADNGTQTVKSTSEVDLKNFHQLPFYMPDWKISELYLQEIEKQKAESFFGRLHSIILKWTRYGEKTNAD